MTAQIEETPSPEAPAEVENEFLAQLNAERKVATREDLEKIREGIVARAPSGACYRIRQINFERHALAGGLPPTLIHYALEGEEGMEQLFKDMAAAQEERGDEAAQEHFEPMRNYLDQVVISSVVEPELRAEDLGTPGKTDDEGKIVEDALVPASDYQWLVSVAMRATDYDAEGRRLWGIEPLSRFMGFRAFHGCDEDCEGCLGVQAAVALGRD